MSEMEVADQPLVAPVLYKKYLLKLYLSRYEIKCYTAEQMSQLLV